MDRHALVAGKLPARLTLLAVLRVELAVRRRHRFAAPQRIRRVRSNGDRPRPRPSHGSDMNVLPRGPTKAGLHARWPRVRAPPTSHRGPIHSTPAAATRAIHHRAAGRHSRALSLPLPRSFLSLLLESLAQASVTFLAGREPFAQSFQL